MALADAEPKADADPYYGYYGLGYHGLGYGLGYGYGHGLGYAGYYGHGLGHYGYYGHGYGLGYARYGYGLGHHYGYAGLGHYGYGLGYYGKRSAEAEPPLMLMPRLIPTTDTTATDTTVLDTAPTVVTTDTATTDTATAMACTDTTVKCPADSSQPKTSLGITSSSSEKWIAQVGLIPTSATSFSATRLAQARNGEQEAKEKQNVLIRRIKKL